MLAQVLAVALAALSWGAGQKTNAPLRSGPVVVRVAGPASSPQLNLPSEIPGLGVVTIPAAVTHQDLAVDPAQRGVTGLEQTPHAPAQTLLQPASLSAQAVNTRSGTSIHTPQAQAVSVQAPIAENVAALQSSLENPQASGETLSVEAEAIFDGDKKKAAAPVVAGKSSFGSFLTRRTTRVAAATAAILLSATPALAQGAAPAAQTLSHAPVWAAAALGFALGMRHALDPDHVVALLNLVSGSKSKWKGWRNGALWGLGHSLALLVIGGGLVLAKTQVPEQLAAGLESLVALMLIGLGLNALRRERKTAEHGHYHDLEKVARNGMKPFLIGLVHGLAGSGAVALLALAAVPGAVAGFLYLGMFGVGTIAGMSVVTFFLQALAVGLVSDPKKRGRVAIAAGLLSAAFGAFMLYELLPVLLGA